MCLRIRDGMARMRGLPPVLVLILALKVLESYCDFVTGLNLTLFLSRDLHLSDTDAGLVYGAWGVTTSIAGIALGTTIDQMGVRNALLVGSTCSFIGRLLLAATRLPIFAYISLFGFLSIGEAFAIPVLSIAIRHLVAPASLSIAFSMFYMAMQVGAIVSGVVTDTVHTHAGPGALGYLMWTTPFVTAGYLAVVHYRFPRASLVHSQQREHASTPVFSCVTQARHTFANALFWRLVGFSLLLTGSRTVWRHLDVSMPKYILRTMGETARYGDVYAVNPAIVLLSVTLVQALTAAYDAYDVIVVGTLITTLSPLVLYVGDATYLTLVVFMAVLSLGEVLYSPRVYEYGLRMAPLGHEGTYSALASAPLFLIRIVSGAASGLLLERYCDGDTANVATPSFIHHCQSLWLVVTLGAMTTPLGLMVARRCLYTPDVRARVNNTRPLVADDDSDTKLDDV